MSQNGTSATTLLRVNLRQLREQLTQDGGDLGHLGTGGVFGAPAAGEQIGELWRERLRDLWPLALRAHAPENNGAGKVKGIGEGDK